MKELLLILKGMSREENKNSLVNYGEFQKIITLLLEQIAPEKIQEAKEKLKTE